MQVKLGRSEEALDDAWDQFREYPSLFAYEDLMRFVPKPERKIWHAKAIEAAKEADLHSLLELLLKTKEIDRIADLLSETKDGALEELSHFSADPVAKVLARTRPQQAARLWRAQGVRILNAKKSRAYPAALSYFENAKHCFERAGLGDEWMKTVNRVRADHHRNAKGLIEPRTNLYPGTRVRMLDKDIVLNRRGSMPLVRFPHRQHTASLDCSICHEQLFKAKAGANRFSMMQILQGEQCGLCHGAVAFPLTECYRCHSVRQRAAGGGGAVK